MQAVRNGLEKGGCQIQSILFYSILSIIYNTNTVQP